MPFSQFSKGSKWLFHNTFSFFYEKIIIFMYERFHTDGVTCLMKPKSRKT